MGPLVVVAVSLGGRFVLWDIYGVLGSLCGVFSGGDGVFSWGI